MWKWLVLSCWIAGQIILAQDNFLISATELDKQKTNTDLVILDLGTVEEFNAEHIENARHASFDNFVESRNELLNEAIIDSAKMQKNLRQLGIAKNSHIVLVWRGKSKKSLGKATKAFFVLHGFGLKVTILDGGFEAWKKAKLNLTSNSTKSASSEIVLEQFATEQLVSLGEVTSCHVVDARPNDFFIGKTKKGFVQQPGTIPGASNLPFGELVKEDLTFLSVKDIQKKMADINEKPAFFCNSGYTATITWFGAKLAGKEARLYDGSMNEWASKHPTEVHYTETDE